MVVEPSGGDGLTFTLPVFKESGLVRFNGKDYSNGGRRVAPGTTTAGKRIDDHTLELTDKLKNEVMDTQSMNVSSDNETLMTMSTYPGVAKKQVFVYHRQ